MGYSLGYDSFWNRDIGYGVPAICDHPGCNNVINRGLSYVCGGEPYGGEKGCGLYFCSEHLSIGVGKKPQLCENCRKKKPPFSPKEDSLEWTNHKLTDDSWEAWRKENPEEVKRLKK